MIVEDPTSAKAKLTWGEDRGCAFPAKSALDFAAEARIGVGDGGHR
jgi:hypothetical protein